MRRYLVLGLALVLVAGLLVTGVVVWQQRNRTPLEQALDSVPKASLRVGFTDWSVVRSQVKARLGDDPDSDAIEKFMDTAYDRDFTASSSLDAAAVAMHQKFGFGPVNAQWEAYAQSPKGAAMVLKVAEDTDFDVLADNLRAAGYEKPQDDDGVWNGGIDLVAGLDPSLTPEVQYVALLEDQGLVVSSDKPSYAKKAAEVASGEGDSAASAEGVADMAGRLEEPANAMVWAGDFACEDLAMARADEADQSRAEDLVRDAGGVTPLDGLMMGMLPNRTLRVVAHFEDGDRAEENLRPRARLAVGDAPGRGVSFADDYELTSSSSRGSDVVLDLKPRQSTGYVLSALYDGPVLFATC